MADEGLTVSSEKNWLVKSSARILGPFTIAELAENLKLKNISIIDEIRLPAGRWCYIRENKILLEVIRKIRDEEDPHSEKTMTQSIAQHTVTRTDATGGIDDLTPAPFIADIPSYTDSSIPGGIKDISASEFNLPRTIGMGGSKHYGSSNDANLQSRIANRSKFLKFSIIGLTAAIAIAVALNLTLRSQAKDTGYEDLRTAAIRNKSLGLFQKSLLAYQKASKIKEPDLEFSVEMAPVLISEDRQTLQGRRILEKVLGQEGKSRSEILDAYLAVALSYMLEGDVQQAEKTLQKSLGHDPANYSALMNLAILQIRKNRFAEASRSFDELYRRNSRSSLALFGRSIGEIEYARQTKQSNHLRRLEKDLDSHTEKNPYLRQELTLLRAYALKLMGDVDAVNQAVVQFLGYPPGESNLYGHPLFIDWRFSRWEALEKYCQLLYSESSPHAALKSLRATCFMENNRDADASRLLQEAKAEAPKDPYVLQTEAAYLMKVARYPEALTLLKMPEMMNLTGKNTIWNRYCYQQNDTACVQTNSNQTLQSDPRAVDAYFGLAWVASKKKNRTRAYDFVRSGLEIEPLYLPLLELRDSLEAR